MLQYGFLFCLKTCMIIHELSEMMILEELGMIIGFVIWSFCAVLFFIVGVVDLKSAKPVIRACSISRRTATARARCGA